MSIKSERDIFVSNTKEAIKKREQFLLKSFLFFIVILLSLNKNLIGQTFKHPTPPPDTISTNITLPDVVITETINGKYPPLSNQERCDHWRHIRDVKLVLPFSETIAKTLIETYEYMETFQSEKEKRAHLTLIEKSLKEDYEPIMRKLTLKQGELLIKLINRETNSTSYELIKALYGGLKASYYNVFAIFCGGNLRKKYRPDKDPTDAFTERIIFLYKTNQL